MSIAIHLRHPALEDIPDSIFPHLTGIYPDEKNLPESKSAGHGVSGIYIGDEFCFHRLPKEKELDEFCRSTRKACLSLALLTTPMTQPQLESYAPIFSHLSKLWPDAEVVANDIGVLFYLRKTHPGFRISAGRLLNKGYADPRQDEPGKETNRCLTGGGAFEHGEFLSVLTGAGVRRLELDLPPHANWRKPVTLGIKTSVYFPFGYAATGRMCQTASFGVKGRKKFLIADSCARSCDGMGFELKHRDFKVRVFQNGNTVYYLYHPAVIRSLLSAAVDDDVRIIYQGLAVAVS
jgi:hypothetical protein